MAQKINSQQTTLPVWTTPTLNSGWVNFDSGAIPNTSGTDTWRFPRYTKDVSGVVHITGLTTNTSGVSRGNGSIIFTLPSGFRPGHTLMFMCSKATPGGETWANIRVTVAGEVCVFGASTTVLNNELLSLNNINFVAEQ